MKRPHWATGATSFTAGAERNWARLSLTILDVRRADERATSYIDGSLHIELPDLVHHVDDVPYETLWVHCATGFRASIAASLLDRAGRKVVVIDDDYERATEPDFHIITP